MATKKMRHIWYLGRKGKDKVGLIKSLIYTRVGRGALRGMLYKIF